MTRQSISSAHFFHLSAAKHALQEARPAGGAFYAADKQKKCAEKVNKHVQIECIVSTETAGR